MPPRPKPPEIDMATQLESLYAERERLFRELGTADADEVISLVRGLELQLADVYAEREAAFHLGAAPPPPPPPDVKTHPGLRTKG
jgi:hypothetical protein